MPTYPVWFEHTRCSLCEHFQKKTVTCTHNTKESPLSCNMSNHHTLFSQSLQAKSKQAAAKKKKPSPLTKKALKDIAKGPGLGIPVKQGKQGRSDSAPCTHPNLQPYMQQSGKRTFDKSKEQSPNRHYIGRRQYIDWTGNIINAHYLKVIKYWCPTCNTFITPPSDTED